MVKKRRLDLNLVSPSILCIVLCMIGSIPTFAKKAITYSYNFYGSPVELNRGFMEVIERFNISHPDIEVKGVAHQGQYDKLIAQIAGGAPPDVAHFEQSAVIEWAHKGLLEPLDDVFTPSELGELFVQGDCSEVIFDGHVWGIPWHTSVRGVMWNKDVLEEVGISGDRGPRTLNDLADVAKKGTKVDSQGKVIRWGFLPWVGSWHPAGWFWAFGGEVYDSKTYRPTLDMLENVKAFEWEQDFAKLYPLGPRNVLDFIAGRLVMMPCSNSEAANARRSVPDMRIGTGEMPYPPGGRNGTWIGSTCHIIPKGAKNLTAAKAFLKWLAGEDAQIIYYNATSLLPTNRKAVQNVFGSLPAKDPVIPLLRQLPIAHGRPPLWAKLIGRLIAVEQAEIITFKRNPKDVLSDLQREMLLEYAAVFGK